MDEDNAAFLTGICWIEACGLNMNFLLSDYQILTSPTYVLMTGTSINYRRRA